VTGTASDDTVVENTGSSIGDCADDAFSVSSPGHSGSPVICGFNSGQHMIVDASEECHTVAFHLGSAASTSRTWDIKVTQYYCGEESVAGPQGCLQYFTGDTGTVSSFNFPTTASTVATSSKGMHM